MASDPAARPDRRMERTTYRTAARILPLVDLTSLADSATEAQIETLCARAIDAGVAAICLWPRFVPLAKVRLDRSPIRLATVVNFPEGSDDLARAAHDTASAVAAGADEVDVVAPIEAMLDGDIGLVTELVQACRKASPEATLKVILETGRLAEPASPRLRAPRSWAAATCSRRRPADFRSAPPSRLPQCCSP